MADYLRDQFIKNVAVGEDALRSLSRVFEERAGALRDEISLAKGIAEPDQHVAFLTYIIRFDNKGYRLWDIEEVIRWFQHAESVERVVFTLASAESLESNRTAGAYLELGLDTFDEGKCTLVSSSDTRDWTDSSFSAVAAVLGRCRTRHGLVRAWWANLFVQLLGVALGFALSLWLAVVATPFVKVESAFLLVFLFMLLVWSNVWVHINGIVIYQIGRVFPNVEFRRSRSTRWLLQSLIGSAVFAVVVFVVAKLLAWVVSVMQPYLAL